MFEFTAGKWHLQDNVNINVTESKDKKVFMTNVLIQISKVFRNPQWLKF